MKLLFLQISSDILQTDDVARRIYEQQKEYHRRLGSNQEYFLELPKWVAHVYKQVHRDVECRFEVITNTDINSILKEFNPNAIAISVMEVNKNIYHKLIDKYEEWTFLVGGYCTDEFLDYPLTYIANTPSDIAKYFRIEPVSDIPIYSLFDGEKTVPRIQLSTGCRHSCKFCTIANEVKELSEDNIAAQMFAISVLDFKYVYVDDKTFGQCSNYRILKDIYKYFKAVNSEFKGFIVQTTTLMFNNKIAKEAKELGIVKVELGIETYNNDILNLYNKPSSVYAIDEAIDLAMLYTIDIVPNIIVGIPEETTYNQSRTLSFLELNKNIFSFINIFQFSDYNGEGNKNENSIHKNNIWMVEELLKLNEEILANEKNS